MPTVIKPRSEPLLLMTKPLAVAARLLPTLMAVANRLPLLAMVTTLLTAVFVPMANTAVLVQDETAPVMSTC
ncbi:MAG: hypothetical protein PCFJNLEI_04149 [Verrucomicrobiae bacterium]|nr:hypothetical protein [Verrucomicrobiae bacterium]